MSQQPLLLGLDVGTTGIKALLVDRSGQRQGFATAPTPFSRGPEGVQMSAEALQDGMRQVLAALGRDRQRVAGVGLAGMAESGAGLDADGRALGPILAWHDRRGQDTVSRLTERFGSDLATRIGQPLRAVSSVAKLGWLCAQGVGGLRRWLGVPELCLFWLSGTAATEYSLAARTGC
ncbi:MAG: FGGY family carbohydrate kinase, partial [Actinomycetota bacterium]|nr:FGGY family carbohydrate kinase [Actinomycetota bacterium]